MMQDQVMGVQNREMMLGVVAGIEDKHRDLQKIEQSLRELHGLFVDLSILIDAQGETINQIDKNVCSAHTKMARGVRELHKAREYQKKARKKACCLAMVFIVILLIILGPVIASSGALSSA